MVKRFDLLKAEDEGLDPSVLNDRETLGSMSDHWAFAKYFQPGGDLVEAVNIALAVEAPLLLTGDPGTGKTQVAFYLARHFGLARKNLHELYVKSTTRHEDLLYSFDDVAYFHTTQAREQEPAKVTAEDLDGQPIEVQPLDKRRFRTRGPLWRALRSEEPSIVLVDEIDKAPRDFPNDLLNVLDQHRFRCPVTDENVETRGSTPLVVITSNNERRLPDPFLRRVIFHYIRFDTELLHKAVKARDQELGLPPSVRDAALRKFEQLRERPLSRIPATAELLVWLAALSVRGIREPEQLGESLRELPLIQALVKDREDLEKL